MLSFAAQCAASEFVTDPQCGPARVEDGSYSYPVHLLIDGRATHKLFERLGE